MESAKDASAFAQFFDDVRHEAGGKTSFMGQYTGTLIIIDPSVPIDRLVVVINAHWPAAYWPATLKILVEITGETLIQQDIAMARPDHLVRPDPPFDRNNFLAIVVYRGRPFVPGDVIQAWLILDDEKIPAGHLAIAAVPLPPA